MEYIVIPTNSKSEKSFYLGLLKKMQKRATTISDEDMEDFAFLLALKEAEESGTGSLSKVKDHLAKVATR
ncbi:MAG: hypothetical protein ACTHK8_06210 [Ginsengibacter sp.]|jgi:hypothetical protein